MLCVHNTWWPHLFTGFLGSNPSIKIFAFQSEIIFSVYIVVGTCKCSLWDFNIQFKKVMLKHLCGDCCYSRKQTPCECKFLGGSNISIQLPTIQPESHIYRWHGKAKGMLWTGRQFMHFMYIHQLEKILAEGWKWLKNSDLCCSFSDSSCGHCTIKFIVFSLLSKSSEIDAHDKIIMWSCKVTSLGNHLHHYYFTSPSVSAFLVD